MVVAKRLLSAIVLGLNLLGCLVSPATADPAFPNRLRVPTTSSQKTTSSSSIKPTTSSSSHTTSTTSTAQKTTTTSSSVISVTSSTFKTSTTSAPATTSSTSTSSTTTSTSSAFPSATSAAHSLFQNALVIATDASAADEAVSLLQGYGQPTTLLSIPQAGAPLPALETGNSTGNFGLIIIIGLVTYDFGGTTGWASAITADQWNTLYAYQLKYSVRMIHLDSFPGSFNGTTVAPGPGGCCSSEDQLVYLLDPTFVPTAGLKKSELSTEGLWHYPAIITDPTTTTEFLEFAANTEYPSTTVAGVLQNFGGREQMVIFVAGGSWSLTTNYLGHVWFHWGYRGIYNGFRRVAMHQQIDDLFLDTDIWNVTSGPDPEGQRSRINTTDLQTHMTWQTEFVQTLNPGSVYFMEVGFNGNGNMDFVGNLNSAAAEACPDSEDVNDPIGPPQNDEWIKPLGTGVNMWPANAKYVWSKSCILLDPLASFFQIAANRDAFAWISHTFTHEDLENSTYYDTNLEMAFNYQHAVLLGITNAKMWSNSSFIPPGITGLHNGDALRAFMDNGIRASVGDSTRPVLLNPTNKYWPLITTVAGNGFAGFTIIPRWATRVYYNVGNQYESADEWRSLSPSEAATGAGDIYALLKYEEQMQVSNLLALSRAPFMFHQANLRVADVLPTTINGVTKQRSLYQMWAETVGSKFVELTNWPLIALKEDDLINVYVQRMAKDQCNPTTQLLYSGSGNATAITGFVVDATNHACSVPIPVTLPGGSVTNLQGSTTEQVGNDPLTLWVTLSGTPKTFTLSQPIAL